MKYLIIVLLLVGCNNKPVVVTKAITHYPKVVYNSCSDIYAVVTDTNVYHRASFLFFGKNVPVNENASFSNGVGVYFGSYNQEVSEPAPPSLVVISQLHDTLRFANLGGEFQFKDSITALKTYLSFVKECKDSEDLQNIPIRKKIKEFYEQQAAKHIKDSIAHRAQFVADSIYKCRHTYN